MSDTQKTVKATSPDSTVVESPSRLDALVEKRSILEGLNKVMFAGEIASVDAEIAAEERNSKVGAMLDKLGITAITGSKVDGEWNISRLRTGDNPGTASTGTGNGNGDRRPRVYNGVTYNSAKALCDTFGYDTTGRSAVRVLAAHAIVYHDLPLAS